MVDFMEEYTKHSPPQILKQQQQQQQQQQQRQQQHQRQQKVHESKLIARVENEVEASAFEIDGSEKLLVSPGDLTPSLTPSLTPTLTPTHSLSSSSDLIVGRLQN